MSTHPTTSSRNFNVEALKGGSLTDMEFCEEFKLDYKLAGTKEINWVMLDKVEQQNLSWYLKEGKSEAEAKTMARNNRRIAEQDIKKLLKRYPSGRS